MKRTQRGEDESRWEQRCLLRQSDALSPEEAAEVDREMAADPARARYAREATATTRMGRVLLPDEGPSAEVLSAIEQAAEQATASRRVIHFPLVTMRRLAMAALALAMVGMSLRVLPLRQPRSEIDPVTSDARWLLAAVSDELEAALGDADPTVEAEDRDAMAQQLLEWQGFAMDVDSDAEEEWLTPLLPLLPADEPTALQGRSTRAFRATARG